MNDFDEKDERVEKDAPTEEQSPSKRPPSRLGARWKGLSVKTRSIVVAVSSILLAAIVTSLVLFLFWSCNQEGFDYRRENLSPYISLDQAMLSGLSVSVVPKKTVTDAEAEASLNEMLLKEAADKTYKDEIPTAEDRVSFLYRVELDGKDVHQVSNYYSSSLWVFSMKAPEPEEDGSPSEPPYYEALRAALKAGLSDQGRAPSSYWLKERKEGTVGYGSPVYVNMTLTELATGEQVARETARRIDLGNMEDSYFYLASILAPLELGKNAVGEFYHAATGKTLKYDITPLFVVTEEVAIECDVTLPEDFGEDSEIAYLGGKTVHFYLVPQGVVRKEVPVLTDEFVESLSGGLYSGNGAADKFRADWKLYMQSAEDSEYAQRLNEALEKKLLETLQPSSYPEKALAASRQELWGLFRESYDAYVADKGSSEFPTIEAYINKSFDVTTDAAREELIERIVQDTTKSYLVYFAAADALGVRPTDAEIDTVYQAELKNMSAMTLAAYTKYYGENYLYDQVSYLITRDKVIAALAATAVVIPAAESSGE